MAHTPPLLRCVGVRHSGARALVGVYELYGVAGGRPCYRQIGVSSGNFLWYSEVADGGSMWVVTPKAAVAIGECPDSAVARCRSTARWPWEVDAWEVCNTHCKKATFVASAKMRFVLVMPAAELVVSLPLDPGATLRHADEAGRGGGAAFGAAGDVEESRYRYVGDLSDHVAFRKAEMGGSERLFFMPAAKRWLVASVDDHGEGVRHVLARSRPVDDSSWASLWPWEVGAGMWETPSTRTVGLKDGDATWAIDPRVGIRLASPDLELRGSLILDGIYRPRGMVNGRVFYIQELQESSIFTSGPVCLWYAEDRAQWVMTGPDQLGDSRVVRGRVKSCTWWPWEAHIGGTTAPESFGSAPLASSPAWQGGAAMLAGFQTQWEEIAEADGTLRPSSRLTVEPVFEHWFRVSSAKFSANYQFIGEYRFSGFISSRPFFVQRYVAAPKKDAYDINLEDRARKRKRSAIWYAEATGYWVITSDFRILDCSSIHARVDDSCWFPWEAVSGWEVPDGAGGFITDWNLNLTTIDCPEPEDDGGQDSDGSPHSKEGSPKSKDVSLKSKEVSLKSK
eukprot:TRINITY_DN17320_c0_g1_i2.p1 TRINITY_DN17320_c0_g1~~TRINITY_DN17320_c0_g1_i2.p1  ORF type:complete len:565 (-),score=107.04 TRINITY_DN17320_c0_g1_i2:96-1790(-)